MKFIVLFLSNLIISGLIINFLYKKFALSDFFNRDTKCYFLKERDELDELGFKASELIYQDKKDDKYVIYNERFKFFELGLVMPFTFLIVDWPLLYYLPNNILGWCMIIFILVIYYNFLVVYLRFKLNHRKLLDENATCYITPTLFPLVFNIVPIFSIGFFVFGFWATHSKLALIVLVCLFIKLHLYIYVDKIEDITGWNILTNDNLRKIGNFEYYLFFILFGILVYIWHTSPVNVLLWS